MLSFLLHAKLRFYRVEVAETLFGDRWRCKAIRRGYHAEKGQG
ncbi:MAG: hypothetical protein WBP18_02320 [Paracoccaceae bacterium]